ncbi:MAG: hypothetical protein ACOCSR_00095 [Wenzhouxiangella sp.]
MAAEEKKYRAEVDLHTLVEAEKIKKDSARMKAAMQCRKEKMAAMASVGNHNSSNSKSSKDTKDY